MIKIEMFKESALSALALWMTFAVKEYVEAWVVIVCFILAICSALTALHKLEIILNERKKLKDEFAAWKELKNND